MKNLFQINKLEEINTLIRNCSLEKLSSAYQRRGEILQLSNKHNLAIEDFQQSLQFNNERHQDFKIHNKIAQSQAKLGCYTDAIETLKHSLKCLNCSNLDNELKGQYGKTIVMSIKRLQNKPDSRTAYEDQKSMGTFKMESVNPEVPGICGKVKIVSDDVRGRHAIAAEEISPGTIVAAGQPTVAILNPDDRQVVETGPKTD